MKGSSIHWMILSGLLVISVTGGVFVDKIPLLRQHCWNFSYVGFHTA